MKRTIFAAMLTLVAMQAAADPVPLPWTDLVVFGDSLSDNGNFGAGIVATNGNTWAGQLGALPFGGGGTNFAYGGATAVTNADFAPDFDLQRAFYAATRPTLGSNPAAVVWFGGNDLLNVVDPTTAPAVIAGAIAAIGAGIGELVGTYGFNRILVPGLPDLSLIPRLNTAPDGAKFLAQQATFAFNSGLQALVAGLQGTGVRATYLDLNRIFMDILGNPASFGFTNTTATCERGILDCDTYVFWDDIHPTARTHSLIAAAAREALTPAAIPLPGGVILLLTGLGGMAVLRRRQAVVARAA